MTKMKHVLDGKGGVGLVKEEENKWHTSKDMGA